ncbi:hypothetical protein [Hyphomicrobium sp.]|uniref:hypothetical protein n=1 Tax=Hyphomicrobium sp. TaxID=82 RepID=UPI0025C70814|nr:hypothetical protein [Hyphomicrobium sp.]MCC7252548.1 hypothetical protein [Hyphomicrobium sp.]
MTSSPDHGSRSRLGRSAALAALALPLAAFGMAPPAEARIRCENGYQIVNGSPISTPYCQDALLGRVARARGWKVSDAAIRNNPNLKRHVCQHVGRDIRVYMACIDANSLGRRFH